MQHLIWLCGDANALYDVALGMYDLELAAMVAAQAQMDPKEFLPYLQVRFLSSSRLAKVIFLRLLSVAFFVRPGTGGHGRGSIADGPERVSPVLAGKK